MCVCLYIEKETYIYVVIYDSSLLPSPLFLPLPLPMQRNTFRDPRSGWEGRTTRSSDGVIGLVPTDCPRLTKFAATVWMCLTHEPLPPSRKRTVEVLLRQK